MNLEHAAKKLNSFLNRERIRGDLSVLLIAYASISKLQGTTNWITNLMHQRLKMVSEGSKSNERKKTEERMSLLNENIVSYRSCHWTVNHRALSALGFGSNEQIPIISMISPNKLCNLWLETHCQSMSGSHSFQKSNLRFLAVELTGRAGEQQILVDPYRRRRSSRGRLALLGSLRSVKETLPTRAPMTATATSLMMATMSVAKTVS